MVDYADEIFADDRLLTLYEYWQSKLGDRLMPAREDIDPTEIAPLLPHIMLVDVVGSGSDFRIRMVGTALNESTGGTATGRLVSQIFPPGDYADYVLGLHTEMVEEKVPIYGECIHDDPDLVRHATLRLIMPLSEDGENVTAALVGQVFEIEEAGVHLLPSDEAGPFEENVRVLMKEGQ